MNSFTQDRISEAKIVAKHVTDSTHVALVVKYIGSAASGVITVNSARSLVFTHGPVGSEVADTTIGAPTLNGTIDVTDATADTFGEVVDLINASANWVAYLRDCLRSDSSNASTGSLKALSATAAKVSGGVGLLLDTAKTLEISVAVRGADITYDFKKDSVNRVSFNVPEKGKWSELMKIISNNTFGSGTSLIKVYRVNRLTGASVLVVSQSGAATTVDQTLDKSDDNGRGLACLPDEYLLVRIIGSAAMTGFIEPYGKVI